MSFLALLFLLAVAYVVVGVFFQDVLGFAAFIFIPFAVIRDWRAVRKIRADERAEAELQRLQDDLRK